MKYIWWVAVAAGCATEGGALRWREPGSGERAGVSLPWTGETGTEDESVTTGHTGVGDDDDDDPTGSTGETGLGDTDDPGDTDTEDTDGDSGADDTDDTDDTDTDTDDPGDSGDTDDPGDTDDTDDTDGDSGADDSGTDDTDGDSGAEDTGGDSGTEDTGTEDTGTEDTDAPEDSGIGGDSGGSGGPPPPVTYEDRCRDAGVQLPPEWSRWTRVADVPTPVSFGMPVTLWEWRGSNTHCTGLYRDAGGGGRDALGMICMDTRDGDTCFWDNKDARDDKIVITGSYTVDDALGGDLLVENCTSCHRGSNPWLQNEEAPLTGLPQPPGDRWRPVGGRAGWDGWDPMTSARGTSCDTGCHKANNPTLTREYCGIALKFQAEELMDDAASDNWTAFQAACRLAP